MPLWSSVCESVLILVIGDASVIREEKDGSRGEGRLVRVVPDPAGAVRAVESETWDLVLLDLDTPGADGVETVRRLKEAAPRAMIVAVTGRGSMEGCVAAMRAGARDYLVKPVGREDLDRVLKDALEARRRAPERPAVARRQDDRRFSENIVGESPAMGKVFDTIRKVAATGSTVLVTGETGTGKELVARAIHSNSSRRYGPFIAVSCAALPETLLESELFGYERGAFTGADRAKKGRFELAHGGTLFLDEIGEMGKPVQVKLLRVLQERCVDRLGGTRPVPVDVRVIAATNRDLEVSVKAGTFRDDLYYRLNVVNIHLPALRERKRDIPLLADRFMERFNAEFGKRFERIDQRAMGLMLDYAWPGNVRELENVIERAVVIDNGPEILPAHLPFCAPAPVRGLAEPPTPGTATETAEPLTLEEAEKRHILKMLDLCGWNVARTARVLAIDRTTLHKKIQRHGLERRERK